MIAAGNKLYVGGGFTIVTGVNQQRYAVFSGAPPANTPPVVDSVVIDQSSPGTNATLSATVAAHDADGNPLTLGYQWTRNGTDIAGATAAVLDMSVAGRGDKGDLIRLRVTANDGTANSSPLTSSPVTVGNTAPSATVALDSHTPGTNAVLQATAVGTDADADAVSFTYVWTVNGTIKRTTTTSASTDSLDLSVAGNGDPDDVIVVTVTPNDGTANGSPGLGHGDGEQRRRAADLRRRLLERGLHELDVQHAAHDRQRDRDPGRAERAAQVTNQSASAYKDLASPVMTACTSLNVNVIVREQHRPLPAAHGHERRDHQGARGNERHAADPFGLRGDDVQLGRRRWARGSTAWSSAARSGSNTTWDLYRDGVKIVNAWATNTGTTAIGRVQIGDTAAKTFTVNFDNVRVDTAPGENQAPDTTAADDPRPTERDEPVGGHDPDRMVRLHGRVPPITYRVYRDGGSDADRVDHFHDVHRPRTRHRARRTRTPWTRWTRVANPSAKSVASAPILVTSAAPAIFADDFSSGNFANWTVQHAAHDRQRDAAVQAAPSARAQVTSQSASAYKDLASPVMTACTEPERQRDAPGRSIDLFRLRTAANGAIIKVSSARNGTLQIRSDFAATTFSSGVADGHRVPQRGAVRHGRHDHDVEPVPRRRAGS